MDPQPVPPPPVYEDIARVVDHTLLRPDFANTHIIEGLAVAKRYRVAAVTVRQCDVDLAARTLQGSSVRLASVCAWPYGWQTTSAKLYEARDLLRRGVREIEMVVPTARLLSREFQHVASELSQMAEACHKEGAIFKAALEMTLLTDELKIIACRCCESGEVDLVAAPGVQDVTFLRKYLPDEIGIKIAAGFDTLESVLEAKILGAIRVGTESSAAILEAWKARLAGTVLSAG